MFPYVRINDDDDDDIRKLYLRIFFQLRDNLCRNNDEDMGRTNGDGMGMICISVRDWPG